MSASAPPVPHAADLDLDAYLARVGWQGSPEPSADVLRRLQRAHILAIPFENTEPLLTRRTAAPSLQLHDLQAKLVRGRRGGYCFEQNTLFTAALRTLGFEVRLLAARVLVGARPGTVRPRTHMCLLVHAPGETTGHLADVGFGTPGLPLTSVPLAEGEYEQEGGHRVRLLREHAPDRPLADWELHSLTPQGWNRLYGFTVEPFESPDFDVANWQIATDPHSPFSQAPWIVRTLPGGAHRKLSGRTSLTLTESLPDGTRHERPVADGAEAVRVLDEEFGIGLPPGSRLLAREGEPSFG